MKRKILVFLLSGCFLSLKAVNFDRYKRDLINSYFKRIGPFYLQPILVLNGIGYDFNLYTNALEPEGDWFVNAGPGLRASFIRNRFLVSGIFTPSYLYYFHHKDENFLNYKGKIDTLLRLGKLHFYFGYQKTRNRIRPTFELGPRIKQRTEGFFFSTELAPGYPLSFELTGSTQRYVYEDTNYLTGIDLGARLNRRENSLAFIIRRRIFSKTRLLIEMGYKQLRFNNPAITSDADQRWVATGVRFPEIGVLTGAFKLGYKEILLEPYNATAFSGLFGNGNVVARIGRLQFVFFYTLDWNYSYWELESIYRLENYGLRSFFFITRNVKFGGGYRQGKLVYSDTDITNRFKVYEAYLLFRVAERTGIGITYYYQRYNSDFSAWNRYISYIGGVITNGF